MCIPVDGGWSLWDEWTPCSSSCGTGTTERARTCTNPTPTGTGTDCPGDAISSVTCTRPKCGLPSESSK